MKLSRTPYAVRRQRVCRRCLLCRVLVEEWRYGAGGGVPRTPFGGVPVTGPAVETLRCQRAKRHSFSPLTGLFTEHVAPEMLYLETNGPRSCRSASWWNC